jgi:hypothetical protein
MIQTHEQKGDFKEWWVRAAARSGRNGTSGLSSFRAFELDLIVSIGQLRKLNLML